MTKVLAGLLLWHSLCVSLSPSLSHELCGGAEAPGAPSSEPGDTTAGVGICSLGTHPWGAALPLAPSPV